MANGERLYFFDNLRTFLIFLVVLFHAGVVYDKNGIGTAWWIVAEPLSSDLPGLMNLMLDIFIMPTIFFISGYFVRASLERKGPRPFLGSRVKRLLFPWLLAVFTLIPLYKAIFLYSRGLPQEHWTSYFHFSNGIFGMGWLWFLPALFLFNVLYLLGSKLNIPTARLTLGWAAAAVFLLSLIYSIAIGALGWYGWTKTALIDFQNEKIVPYFLVFLLGSLCQRLGVFDTSKRNMKLYIAVMATVWIPMNLYAVVLINFFLRPGEYFVSASGDRLLLWIGFHLSMLSLLYGAVTTFQYYFNRQGALGKELGKLSYNVYIIHVVVLGAVALALFGTDIPALVKYSILALATYAGSNLIAYAYARVKTYSR